MWTVIDGIDRTDKIGVKTIQISQTLNDPMPTAKFRVSDQLSQFKLSGLREVVILDENGVANPTENQLLNPLFDIYTGVNIVSYWPISSTFVGTPPTITYNAFAGVSGTVEIDVSPTSEAASYLYTQRSLLNKVVPGQTYTFSATVVRASIANSKGVMTLVYTDSNGDVLGTFTTNITSNGTSQQTVSGLAPANTAFATVSFGATTLASTGCTGQFTFSYTQFEANTFASRGISYPTPACNHLHNNCTVLPNGYTVRQSRLFAGYLSRTNRAYNGVNRRWNTEAFSYMKLLDSSYISGTYSGMTDGQIINALLDQAVYAVHNAGTTVRLISSHNVIGNYLMPVMTFDSISVLDALKQIAAITGSTFFVDYFADLHYFPQNYLNTSFELSDTPDFSTSFPYSELQIDEDTSQPMTRVNVAGGTYTPTWTDSWVGDGVTTQFTLTQVSPQTPITVSVTGATKKVGINGTNTFAQGYDVLLDVSNHFILFNTAPAMSVAIFANYAFASQVRVRAWDLAAIDNSYGIAWEAKVTDNSLVTPQTALERGVGELENYSEGRVVYKFKTQKALIPGQVVPLTSALEGLSQENILVQKAVLSPQGGDIIEYQIEAGAYVPDIIALIKNMNKNIAVSSLSSANGAAIPIIQDDVTYEEEISFSAHNYSVTTHSTTTFYYNNTASKYGYSTYS